MSTYADLPRAGLFSMASNYGPLGSCRGLLRTMPQHKLRQIYTHAMPGVAACDFPLRNHLLAAKRLVSRRHTAAPATALGTSAINSASKSIDFSILSATMTVSLKLLMICSAVGWAMKTRRLPPTTPQVLSQVSRSSECRH